MGTTPLEENDWKGHFLLALFLFAFLMPVLPLRSQEVTEVEDGNVDVKQTPDKTTIEASDGAIIRYSSFDVGSGETVQFQQPGKQARVLNRIRSGNPSQINGNLFANGQVFLTNPAGIVFGSGATVDVGRLYAAAGQISNEDFRNGVNQFTDLSGTVKNLGDVRGSQVHLLGNRVQNFGTVVADAGVVTMTSGEDVLIGSIDESTFARVTDAGEATGDVGPAVENSGTVRAENGKVQVGAGDMYSLAIESTGDVYADEVKVDGGDEGQVQLSGQISAATTAEGNTGGDIDVLGDELVLQNLDLDASGPAGGGSINVGGSRKGDGPLPNASHVFVDSDTTLSADAMKNGDAGDVIVWSDGSTSMYGFASATGGPQGGDGGFVEISGKHLDTPISVADVSAPRGSNGRILFDPTDIEILGGTNDGDDNDGGLADTFLTGDEDSVLEFSDSSGTFQVYESELEGTASDMVLSATDSISIVDNGSFVDDSGSGDPDIRMTDGVSLTLRTRNDSIDFDDGAGDIDLTAGGSLNNLEIITSGSAFLSIEGSVSGDLESNLRLPQLQSDQDINLSTGNGVIELFGNITRSTPSDTSVLSSLFVEGDPASARAELNGVEITTDMDQFYDIPVRLEGTSTLRTEQGGGIIFERRVFSSQGGGGPHSLTVNTRDGAVTQETEVVFGGLVGRNTSETERPLSSLTVRTDPESVTVFAEDSSYESASTEVRTVNDQEFDSAIVANVDPELDSPTSQKTFLFQSNEGDIFFRDVVEVVEADETVESDGSSPFGLAVRTPQGETQFEASLGGASLPETEPDGLAFVETDATANNSVLDLPQAMTVTTTGDQTYRENISLSGDLSLISSTSSGAIDLSSATVIPDTSGLILSLDPSGGPTNLGNAGRTGEGVNRLGDLNFDSATGRLELSGAIVTNSTFDDAGGQIPEIVLTGESTIDTSGSSTASIDLRGPTLNADSSGAHGLTLSAGGSDISLGSVGAGTALANLVVDSTGTTTISGSTIQTDGGPIDLIQAPTVEFDADLTLQSEVNDDENAGNILLGNSDTDQLGSSNASTLTIRAETGGGDGGTVRLGSVGQSNPLGGLTVNAAGSRSNGTVELNGNLTTSEGAINLNNSPRVDLQTSVNMTTNLSGDIDLGSGDNVLVSDNGAGHSLDLSAAGSVSLDDLELDSLTFSGASSLDMYGSITARNGADFTGVDDGDTVTLQNDVLITTGGSDITFGGENINAATAGTERITLETDNDGDTTTGDATAGTLTLPGVGTSSDPERVQADAGDINLTAAISTDGSGVQMLEADANTDGLSTGGTVTASGGGILELITDGDMTIDHKLESNGAVAVTIDDDGGGSNTISLNARTIGASVTFNSGTGSGNTLELTQNPNNTSGDLFFGDSLSDVQVQSDVDVSTTGNFFAGDNTLQLNGGTTLIDTSQANGTISLQGATLTENSDSILQLAAGTGIISMSDITVDTLTFDSGGGVFLGGTIDISSGGIDFSPIADGDTISLTSNATLNASGSVTTTGQNINGSSVLTINAGGNVDLQAVGNSTGNELSGLDVNASSGTTTLNSNINTAGGTGVLLDGASDVDLGTDLTIDTSAGNGPVNLSGGSLDGSNLTINAGGGDVTLDEVGQATDDTQPGSIEVNSTGVTTLNGNITVAGSGVFLSGSTDVDLGSDLTIDAITSGGTVDISGGSLDGNSKLTINTGIGDVFLNDVGQDVALSSLAVDNTTGSPTDNGILELSGNIATQGSNGVNFVNAPDIDLASNVTIDTSTGDGLVDLSGGNVDGAAALTITAGAGDVDLNNIGQGTAVDSLDVTSSGTIDAFGDLATSGSMTFSGDLRTPATTIVLDAGSVQVNQRLDVGDANTDDSVGTLDVNADLTLAESATFDVTLDSTSSFDQLLVDDGDTNDTGGDVTLAGNTGPDITGTRGTTFSSGDTFDVIQHNDGDGIEGTFSETTVRIDDRDFDIRINETVSPGNGDDVVLERVKTVFSWAGGTGNWGDSSNWDGNTVPGEDKILQFNTNDLTENATTTNNELNTVRTLRFEGSSQYSYTVDGDPLTVNGSIVNNAETAQTITNDITLGSSPTVFKASTADLVFQGTIDGAETLEMTGAPGGGNRITIENDIGASTPLSGITLEPSEYDSSENLQELVLAGGDVSTDGNQTYRSPVRLDADTRLLGSGSTDVTFVESLEGDHDLTLEVAGNTVFGSPVGDTDFGLTPIGNTDSTGPTLVVNSAGVTEFVSGLETNSGIEQADSAGPIVFDGDVRINDENSTTTFRGDVILEGGTFVSQHPLAFGSASPNDDVLEAPGGPVTIDTSATDSSVEINAETVVSGDLTVESGAGDIILRGRVSGTQGGSFGLFSSNQTVIQGTVAGTEMETPVGEFFTEGGGLTVIDTSTITTEGSQDYGDTVVLERSTTLTSNSRDLLFDLGIDAATANTQTLELNASEDIVLNDVGVNERLAGLTFGNAREVVMDGTVEVNSNLDFSPVDRVVLLGATNIQTSSANGAMNFTGTPVDGEQPLSLNAGSGEIALDEMGQPSSLDSLEINTSGTVELQDTTEEDPTNTISTTGPIDLSGATGGIRLLDTVKLENGGTQTTVDLTGSSVSADTPGDPSLFIDAFDGTVRLPSLGSPNALREVEAVAPEIVLNGDIRTGNTTSGGPVTFASSLSTLFLNSSVTINSDAGNSGSAGPIDLSATPVEPASAGQQSLTLDAPGGAIRLSDVGVDKRMGGVTFASAFNTLEVNGSISTDGPFDTTVGSGSVVFTGTSSITASDIRMNTATSVEGEFTNPPHDLTFEADGSNGQVQFDSIFNPGTGGVVELRSRSLTSGDRIETDHLALRGSAGSSGNVELVGPNDVNNVVGAGVGDVRFRNTGGFTVDTIDLSGETVGGFSSDGFLELTAGSDEIDIRKPVAAGGNVILFADTLLVGDAIDITADGGAGNINIGPEFINDQGDDVRISSASAGGADLLNLKPGTLESALVASEVRIGGSETGTLSVVDPVDIASGNNHDLLLDSNENTNIGASIKMGSASLHVRSGGDLTLNNTGTVLSTTGTGNRIHLATGQRFVNNAGQGVLDASSGARWLVHSIDPENNSPGGLLDVADFEEFDVSFPDDPVGSGNGFYYEVTEQVDENLTTDIVSSSTTQDQDTTTESTTTQEQEDQETQTTQTAEETQTQVETDTMVEEYSEGEISESLSEVDEPSGELSSVVDEPTQEAANNPSYDQEIQDDAAKSYDDSQGEVKKAEEQVENLEAQAEELESQGKTEQAEEKQEQAEEAEEELEQAQQQLNQAQQQTDPSALVNEQLRQRVQQESTQVQESLDNVDMEQYQSQNQVDITNVEAEGPSEQPSNISAQEMRDKLVDELETKIEDQPGPAHPAQAGTVNKLSAKDPIKGVGGSHIRSVSMSGTKAVPEGNEDVKTYYDELTEDVQDWDEENTLRFQIMGGGGEGDWGFGLINIFLNRETGVYLMRSNLDVMEGAASKIQGTDFGSNVNQDQIRSFEGDSTSLTVSGQLQ